MPAITRRRVVAPDRLVVRAYVLPVVGIGLLLLLAASSAGASAMSSQWLLALLALLVMVGGGGNALMGIGLASGLRRVARDREPWEVDHGVLLVREPVPLPRGFMIRPGRAGR